MVITSPYEHLSLVQTLGEGDERLNINLYRTLLKAVNIPIKYSFPISPFHLSTERFLENIQKKTFGYILPSATFWVFSINPFQIPLDSHIHIRLNQNYVALLTRMILSSKIQGLNFGLMGY